MIPVCLSAKRTLDAETVELVSCGNTIEPKRAKLPISVDALHTDADTHRSANSHSIFALQKSDKLFVIQVSLNPFSPLFQ